MVPATQQVLSDMVEIIILEGKELMTTHRGSIRVAIILNLIFIITSIIKYPSLIDVVQSG